MVVQGIVAGFKAIEAAKSIQHKDHNVELLMAHSLQQAMSRALSPSKDQFSPRFAGQFASTVPALRFGKTDPLEIPANILTKPYQVAAPTSNDRFSYGEEGQATINSTQDFMKQTYLPDLRPKLLAAQHAMHSPHPKNGEEAFGTINREQANQVYGEQLKELILNLGMREENRSMGDDGGIGVMGLNVPKGDKRGFWKWTPESPTLSMANFAEVAAKGDLGAATTLGAHEGLGVRPILELGTEEQIQEYAIPALQGKKVMAYALTEPNSPGSNPGGNEGVTATQDSDQWTLNGEKTWISNATYADAMVVTAKTGDNQYTAFIVDRDKLSDKSQLQVTPVGHKMGLHTSDTGTVKFENLELSDKQRLGEVGDGAYVYKVILSDGRMNIAMAVARIAEEALNNAAYNVIVDRKTKKADGAPTLERYRQLREKMADGTALIETSKLMALHAARLKGALEESKKDGEKVKETDPLFGQFMLVASMAKYFATEITGKKVIDDALQMRGGMGFVTDSDGTTSIAEHYMDSRVARIYEGTSETQLNLTFMTGLGVNHTQFAQDLASIDSPQKAIEVMKDHIDQVRDKVTTLSKKGSFGNSDPKSVFELMDLAEQFAVVWTVKEGMLNKKEDGTPKPLSKISDLVFGPYNKQFHTAKTAEIMIWNQALKSAADHVKQLEAKNIDATKERHVLNWVASEALGKTYDLLDKMEAFREDKMLEDWHAFSQRTTDDLSTAKTMDFTHMFARKNLEKMFMSYRDVIPEGRETIMEALYKPIPDAAQKWHANKNK